METLDKEEEYHYELQNLLWGLMKVLHGLIRALDVFGFCVMRVLQCLSCAS